MLSLPRLMSLGAGAAVAVCAGSAPLSAAQKTATYSANECRPAPQGWQRQGSEFGELLQINVLEFRQHRLRWNGFPASRKSVLRLLVKVRRFDPPPGMVLVLHSDATCTEVAAIRKLIAARLHCGREQTCVEYSIAEWNRTRPPPRSDR
jgi:hypothetical protein